MYGNCELCLRPSYNLDCVYNTETGEEWYVCEMCALDLDQSDLQEQENE